MRKGAAPLIIFRYHDYRAFLRDWLADQKASQSGSSLRKLAQKAGLSASNLSMVLSGSRKLSQDSVIRLGAALDLSDPERSYLENLVLLGDTDSHQVRAEAFRRMSQYRGFKEQNPREAGVFRYLTHWYYVAIREMSALPGFEADPEWIQARLAYPVDRKEIEDALAFLLEHGYVERKADGSFRPPAEALSCEGGVYRLALGQFHREMLALAQRSIEQTPSEERKLAGYTLNVDQRGFEKLRSILSEAYNQIEAIARSSEAGETVYHVELALFPLSRPKDQTS